MCICMFPLIYKYVRMATHCLSLFTKGSNGWTIITVHYTKLWFHHSPKNSYNIKIQSIKMQTNSKNMVPPSIEKCIPLQPTIKEHTKR